MVTSFAVGQRSAEELILTYDARFDVPGRQGECLGRLEMLGAFDRGPDTSVKSAEDVARLAVHVGAHWCRIVRHDVAHRIVQGLEDVEESRPDAEALAEHVLSLRPGDIPRIAGYAAARWYDGAAKIHFRMGDLATARVWFKRAADLAEHAGIDWILPDLKSNFIRADFDERDMAGNTEATLTLREDYEALVTRTEEQLSAGGIDATSVCADYWHELEGGLSARSGLSIEALNEAFPSFVTQKEQSKEWTDKQREVLRGYCSAQHNLSIARRDDKTPSIEGSRIKESRESSERSAAVAWALGDHYRLAQALNHRADLREREGNDAEAEMLCRHVLVLGWARGERIAKQMLARIEARRGSFFKAKPFIDELFLAMRRDRARRGGDLGVDVRVHHYSVGALKKVLEIRRKDAPRAQPEEEAEREKAERLLEQEEGETIRSVRRMVKVATYKTAFASFMQPFFLRRVEAKVTALSSQRDAWMEGVALVEESSSRELLDVLRERFRPKPRGKTDLGPSLPLPPYCRIHPTRGRRSGLTEVAKSEDDPVSRQFRSQREAFERDALLSPIETAPHNDEIGLDLRRFTAAHEGVCIVRYFTYGEGKTKEGKSGPASLGAYVFRDGEPPRFVKLDLSKVQEVIDHIAEGVSAGWGVPCPTPLAAQDMWTYFLAPLWEHVLRGGEAPRAGGALPGHLVLIPAGDLFRVPLHVALVPSQDPNRASIPLCAHVPLSFTTSATVFVNRGRYLLAKQPIDPDDDLCVLSPRSERVVYPGELEDLNWPEEHFHIAGVVPESLAARGGFQYRGPGEIQGLSRLIDVEPEVFVFAGHGMLHGDGDLGLLLEDGLLSHYKIPALMRLPRNKLTVLGACVTGQGATRGGNEVSGFLRAFMGAGAGALAVSLWSADNDSMAAASRALLRAASPGNEQRILRVVQVLFHHYKAAVNEKAGQDRLEACPLVLYL